MRIIKLTDEQHANLISLFRHRIGAAKKDYTHAVAGEQAMVDALQAPACLRDSGEIINRLEKIEGKHPVNLDRSPMINCDCDEAWMARTIRELIK